MIISRINIKEIARMCDVSVATVSRVINNNGRFSEETRRKVLDAIEQTGYQINYNARGLRTQQSYSIGILVPDISNFFFSDVVQRIEEILFEYGYSTIICNTARSLEKESAYLKILEGKSVDGLIVISGAEEFGFDSSHMKKNIPFICIDREPKDRKSTIFISSDHKQGAHLATEELILNGSTKLSIMVHQYQSTAALDRISGFKETLALHSIPFDDQSNVILIDFQDTHWKNKAITKIKENDIDGLFCINDTIAINIMDLLIESGYSIPKEIKIVGFDNTPISNYTSPKLTSIKQDTTKIAEQSVQSLLELLNGSTKAINSYQLVPVELIPKGSTRSK